MRVCEGCGTPLKGGRRDRKFCRAPRCRKAGQRRRDSKMEGVLTSLAEMGADAAREAIDHGGDFAAEVREIVTDWLLAPESTRTVLRDLYSDLPGVVISRYGTPLKGDTDIDYAVESGDWTPMVQAAAHAIRQHFPDYQPDLSRWPDIEHWYYFEETECYG